MLSVGVGEITAAMGKWGLALREQLQYLNILSCIITQLLLITMSSNHLASETEIICFLDNHTFPVDPKIRNNFIDKL